MFHNNGNELRVWLRVLGAARPSSNAPLSPVATTLRSTSPEGRLALTLHEQDLGASPRLVGVDRGQVSGGGRQRAQKRTQGSASPGEARGRKAGARSSYLLPGVASCPRLR